MKEQYSLPLEDIDLVPVRIESAIIKFGHIRGDAARTFMGEMAWFVVQETGGWTHACELSPQDLADYRSIWRLVAKKIIVIPQK